MHDQPPATLFFPQDDAIVVENARDDQRVSVRHARDTAPEGTVLQRRSVLPDLIVPAFTLLS
jgi:hypothetical protein